MEFAVDSISYELGTVLALLVVLVGLVLLTKSLARDYVSKYGGGARKHAQRKNSRTLLDTIDVREDVFFGVATDYALVKIPKRTGGSRQLQIPNAELKRLQRKLLVYLTAKLGHRVNRSVHSYKKYRSIKTNATVHLGAAVVIKLDIVNFFPKVTLKQCRQVLKLLNLTKPVEDRLVALLTTPGGLPQGAPTSPLLSNLVLRALDKSVWYYCWSRGHRYSRYADDITISLPIDDRQAVHRAISFVNHALKRAGFKLNRRRGKFHILRRHQAQRICGVTINSGKTTISRQKRRELRAIRYRLENNIEASISEIQLEGYEAYVRMVSGVSVKAFS